MKAQVVEFEWEDDLLKKKKKQKPKRNENQTQPTNQRKPITTNKRTVPFAACCTLTRNGNIINILGPQHQERGLENPGSSPGLFQFA